MKKSIRKLKALSKNYFFSGLLVVVPLVITILVIRAVFNFLDGWVSPFLQPYLGYWLPGIGILFTFLSIYLIGILVTNFAGRWVVTIGERFLLRIPIAKSIYTSVKQIMATFSFSEEEGNRKVVLVEYPRNGLWSVGMLNGESYVPGGKQKLLNVLVIAAINPTSGFFVLVPEKSVIETDLSVEDAMKWIVSGGIITPEEMKAGRDMTDSVTR